MDYGPYAIAVGLLSIATVWLLSIYKSPRDVSNEMGARLTAVENDHELLARRFERHDVAVLNLTEAVKGLTVEMSKLRDEMGRLVNGRNHRRG